jgi:hypothetical protein
VGSGEWEAIEIKAATASSRTNNIHQLIKITKNYIHGLPASKASTKHQNQSHQPNPSCRPFLGPASPSSKAAIAAPSKKLNVKICY